MYPAGAKRTVHISWSSRPIFVMACVGAAIGFKNFWQFPSLVFEHGGAFLVVYLLCLATLGLPLLAAAFVIGRLGRDAPDGAFRRAAQQMRAHRAWWVIGAMAILGGFLIFSYLSVISGWTIAFGFRAAGGALAGLTADGVSSVFTQLVRDSEKQLFWYTFYIVSIVAVCMRGLRAGLEPVVRYAVPILFGLMLLLLAYAIISGGFGHALLSTFMPDFTRLSWKGTLAAAGHAFFGLSLGTGAMFMYGAYLDRDAPLGRLTLRIVVLDTLAGIVTALTLGAILFAGGVEAAPGLALLFEAAPLAFDHLTLGQGWLTVFFVALIIAAWLSGLALFEPAVMWVIERFHWARPRAAMVCGAVAWVLALAVTLSFNSWSFSFQLFGDTKKFGFFNVLEIFTNQLLLPLVGIGTALFAGWVLKPELVREQLHARSPCGFDAWLWLTRLVVPVILVCIMFQISKLYA